MCKKKKINVENQNRNHKLIERVDRCIVYNFKDPKISGVEKKKSYRARWYSERFSHRNPFQQKIQVIVWYAVFKIFVLILSINYKTKYICKYEYTIPLKTIEDNN